MKQLRLACMIIWKILFGQTLNDSNIFHTSRHNREIYEFYVKLTTFDKHELVISGYVSARQVSRPTWLDKAVKVRAKFEAGVVLFSIDAKNFNKDGQRKSWGTCK